MTSLSKEYVQEFKDPLHYMFFTPAGPACLLCGVGFIPTKWRNHFNKHHHQYSFGKVENGFVHKLQTHVQAAIDDPNRCNYSRTNDTFLKDYCTGCNTLFAHKKNFTRHLLSDDTPCQSENHTTVNCYEMKCGRFYPVQGEKLQEQDKVISTKVTPTKEQQQAVACREGDSVLKTPTKGGACLGTTLSMETNHCNNDHFMQFFGQMPPHTRNKIAHVDSILKKVVSKDDRITDWRKIFHKRIATSEDFIAQMKEDILCFQDTTSGVTGNYAMSKLMDTFVMLDNNFHSIVHGAQGNIRSALVKFKLDEGGDVDNPARWGFRPRSEDSSSQKEEFRPLLKYLHDRECPILKAYLTKMSDPSYTIADAHIDGMIGRLIYELGVESVPNGNYIPWLCRFAQSRCFRLDQGNVCVRSIEQCGSLFSTVLYILRQGVLSCAVMMEHAGNGARAEDMIAHVQKSPVTNIISPWINACRSKKKNEAKIKSSLVTEDYDIICNNAVFKRDDYSTLIPKVAKSLVELFDEAFDGELWKLFIADGLLQFGDDWFHGDVKKTTADREISLSELRLCQDYSLTHPVHQQITSEIELIFHGLGGGGERSKSIQGLFAKQLMIIRGTNSIYYCLDHNKNSSVTNSSRAAANHKLPNSLVVYYLLYRKICMTMDVDGSDVITYIPGRKHFMKDAVACHFGIDRNTFSDIDIRHLWTSASNIVFSDPKVGGTLVAEKDAAEMSNHTAAIHQEFYSTHDVNKVEKMYGAYHRFFGEDVTRFDYEGSISWKEISHEAQLKALQLLCGSGATFHSPKQQTMVDLCCNNRDKHNYFGIECGGGKSMAILIPVTVEFLLKRQTGIRVFIVPYGFLRDSLYKAFTERLSCVGPNIKILSFSGSDIPDTHEASLPSNLTVFVSTAEILLLTIDAAGNLVKYHNWLLHSLARNNRLSAIYFDEIQTCITEFGFRRIYQAIGDYSQFGCPVSILSGSFHPELAIPLMTYFGLNAESDSSNQRNDVNVIQTEDTLGDGFDFFVVECTNHDDIAEYVDRRIKSTSGQVHIICKDATAGKEITDKLHSLDINAHLVHSKIQRATQTDIAERWFNGDLSVLVSTIIALVGNENPKCHEIVVVGIIYNLAALIQAIGRLRKNQRGPHSRVVQVILGHNRWSHDQNCDESDQNMQQLIEAGVMKENSLQLMSGLFHYRSYHSFLNGDGCFMKRLAGTCGCISEECGRCTWCKTGEKSTLLRSLDNSISAADEGQKKRAPVPKPIDFVSNLAKKARVSNARAQSLTLPGGSQKCQTIAVRKNPISLAKNPYTSSTSKAAASKQQHGIQPVNSLAQVGQKVIVQRTKLMQMAHKCELELIHRCLVCKNDQCIGDCGRNCFTCGGNCTYRDCKYHYTKQAAKDLHNYLKTRQICSICLTPIESNGPHGLVNGSNRNVKCPMKKRFRAVVKSHCRMRKLEYGSYLKAIHASRETYHKYIVGVTKK